MKYILSIRTMNGPIYWDAEIEHWTVEISRATVYESPNVHELMALWRWDIIRCTPKGVRID